MALNWWQTWLARMAGQDPAKLNKALPATARLVADIQALRPDLAAMIQLYYDKIAPAVDRMKPTVLAAEKEWDNILPALTDLLKLFGTQIDAGKSVAQASKEIQQSLRLAHPAVGLSWIQAQLKMNGFDPGTIDGKMGPRTDQAVRDYQKARGLKVDGWPGKQTVDSLWRDMEQREQPK